MFTLDMLEVLLPLASFSAAREHSMLAFPWPMASPCPLSLPLFPSAHPLAKCCGKLCVFFHVFISRLSFWLVFFYFLLFFVCFFVCFSPISLPVYLHSRSFLPSLPCARLDFGFGFSSSISISISLGSAAAQLQLAPLTWPTLPTSALAAVSCFLFYLHLFIND